MWRITTTRKLAEFVSYICGILDVKKIIDFLHKPDLSQRAVGNCCC